MGNKREKKPQKRAFGVYTGIQVLRQNGLLLKEQEKDHPKKPDQECFAPLSVASFLTGLLEEQLAILYQKEKKYEEAERIWEHRIVKRVTDIQTALMNMLELSLIKNHQLNFLQVCMKRLLVNSISRNGCVIMHIYSWP